MYTCTLPPCIADNQIGRQADMMRSYLPLFFVVLVFLTGDVLSISTDSFCYAGQPCFPSVNQRSVFAKSVSYHVRWPFQTDYDKLVVLQNVRETRFPSMIVTPTSTEEVQKTVMFVRKFNLRLSIISSGHDYFGRSTWDGSLQMNMWNLSEIHVNLTSSRHVAGEVTIGTGATWLEAYTEVSHV